MKPLTISILLISLILIPNSGYSLKHDIEGWGGLNWSDSMESAKNKIDAEYTQFEDENLKYLCWKKEIIKKNFVVATGFLDNKLVAIALSNKDVRGPDRLEAADVQTVLKAYVSKYGEPTEHQSPFSLQDKYIWIGKSGDLEITLTRLGLNYQMEIIYKTKTLEKKIESDDI